MAQVWVHSEGQRLPSDVLVVGWVRSDVFPADRERLLDAVEADGAPAWVIERIGRLPVGDVVRSRADLVRSLSVRWHRPPQA